MLRPACTLLILVACGGAAARPAVVSTQISAPALTSEPSAASPPSTVLPATTGVEPSPVTTSTSVAPSTIPTTAGVAEHAATDLLASLLVAVEVEVGYDRDLFAHWIDADGDGCDTRSEVLIAESLGQVERDGGCHVAEGNWYSPYDGLTHTRAAAVDIDHVVALAEAWRSGAWQWSGQARRLFANDLTDERTLIAVTAGANRSKGDRDPADWLPPRSTDICRYIGDWLSIKARWRLAIDPAERTELAGLLDHRCLGLVVVPGPALPLPSLTDGEPSPPGAYYVNCDAARAAGAAPLVVGEPGYRAALDRDRDGVACE